MSSLTLHLARRFEPRVLALALVAVIASFAALDFVYDNALDSLVAFRLDDSNPATQNSFSAVVTAALLGWAGALAFAVASLRATIGAGWWRAAGIALVVLGIDQALGLHTWLDRQFDVDANATYVPLVVIAAFVWFAAASLMRGHGRAQLLFAGGIAGWLVSAAFDAARTDRAEALAAGELLEMAAAGLLLLGLFTFARERSLSEYPPREDGRRESTLAIARAAAGTVNLRMLVIVLGCFAVLFGILGAIVYPGGGDLRVFDLNKEQTFPATFSGILLLAAGGLALLNGLVRSETAAGRRWWIVLALVFGFLGIDEIAALHEAVQDRVNVWGQAVLTPIVLVGIYAWWVTLRRLRAEPPAGTLFILGAALWVLSQGVDAAFNEHWGWTVVPEELLEMGGSALFALALLVALRGLVATAPVTAREPDRAPASQRVPAAAR